MAQIYSGFYIRSHSRSLPKRCILRHALCGHMIQQFFQEHLLNAYEVINQGCTNIAQPLEMVKSSIQFMNNPVLLLGDVLHTGTTKYSVKGDDYFSLVTVNFVGSICYIKCHSSFCAAANMNKKECLGQQNLTNQRNSAAICRLAMLISIQLRMVFLSISMNRMMSLMTTKIETLEKT